MFFCVGKTVCLCLRSAAENALVDFSYGKQRDRKSTAQKVGREGRERDEGTANFPWQVSHIVRNTADKQAARGRRRETEAKRRGI